MVLCFCHKKKISIGPEQPPGCTDVAALIVFVLFWCGMVIIASFAAVSGDPYRLVYGADSFGNTCGRKNRQIIQQLNLSGLDLRQKPYLFSMDINNPSSSVWICVEKCPYYQIDNRIELKNYSFNYGSNLCSYEVDLDNYEDNNRFASTNIGPCPVFPIYPSKPILNRCVPKETVKINQTIVRDIFAYLNNIDLLQQLLTDLISCYQEIIAMCLVAFLLSFFVVFCIRFVAAAVIYLMFSMVGLGSLAITALLWYLYANAVAAISTLNEASNGTRILSLDAENAHALLVYAIFSTIVLVVLACLIFCCLWQGTTLVVELFRQAGRCLRATPLLLIQPMWTFLALMFLFVYWSLVVLLLATAANIHATKVPSFDPMVQFHLYIYDFSINAPVKYVWWYHLIGLIWTAEFILACQQIIISGAVALWYFSKDKKKVRCAIWTSTKRLVLYHLGSVALGSLIITLIKLPRLLLMFMEKKLRGSKNRILKCVLTCCTGCLWCVNKFLRYIHHNAYTIIAIEGQDFCPAAKQAFEILSSNALQFSTVNTVGDFVLFMGKCGVTAIVGFFAAIVFESKDSLHFYAIPLLIVCLFSFFIAHCFFSVYEVIIDTLFLCYCENKRIIKEQDDSRGFQDDVTDSSAAAMFFADSSLRDFMNRVIVMDRKDPDLNVDGEELQTLRR